MSDVPQEPITELSMRRDGWIMSGDRWWVNHGDFLSVTWPDRKGAPITVSFADGTAIGVVRTMEELAIVEEIANRLHRQ